MPGSQYPAPYSSQDQITGDFCAGNSVARLGRGAKAGAMSGGMEERIDVPGVFLREGVFLQVAKDRSTLCAAVWHGEICGGKKEVVGDDGLEPPTSSV